MSDEKMDAAKAAQTLWDAAIQGAQSEYDLIEPMNWIDQTLSFSVDVFEKLISSGLHNLMEGDFVESLHEDLETMRATWGKCWQPIGEKMIRARQTS